MSCNDQCTNPADLWYGHEDCGTCSGKDDGASPEVRQWRRVHWAPHAEQQPEPPPGDTLARGRTAILRRIDEVEAATADALRPLEAKS